jgi:benzylsuccinate CoA-transferase BbsF subunit
MAALGPLGGPGLRTILDWAEAEGGVPEALRDVDIFDPWAWRAIDAEGRTEEVVDAFEEVAERVFATRTKDDLYRTAVERVLLIAPVSTVADLHRDRQLDARAYWEPVAVGRSSETVRAPGAWARLSATPLRPVGRPAARGEHRERPWRDALPAEQEAPGETELADPFAGLKVWDMSWVGVGPLTARYLADYGATVIRLDNGVRADVLRVNPPFAGGVPGINRSQFYADFNASKLGLGLDLTVPEGQEVARRLAAWADVVVESFTPKTLQAVGLGYDELKKVNPSLVMLSTCMQGQTGPHRDYRGFGQLMGALTGFYEVTGWPDCDPTMVFGAYTDFVSQRFCATALVAAIDHRRRTGQGQHIDVSQFEASLQFLGTELLDYSANGRVVSRRGARRPARRRPAEAPWVLLHTRAPGDGRGPLPGDAGPALHHARPHPQAGAVPGRGHVARSHGDGRLQRGRGHRSAGRGVCRDRRQLTSERPPEEFSGQA